MGKDKTDSISCACPPELRIRSRITDERHRQKEKAEFLYEQILKKALRQFPRNFPFKRGHDMLKIGDYLYVNACVGDITGFRNRESIIYTPTMEEVYMYSDKGGAVSSYS